MKAFVTILACVLASAACSPANDPGGESAAAPTWRALQDAEGRTVAAVAGETLYFSAIGPADPQGPLEEQARSAMERLGGALALAGLDYAQVTSCHVHLTDMENYAAMNSVYGGYFPEGGYPARTTLEVAALPEGSGMMLMCVAFADSADISVITPSADQIPPAMGPYSPAVRAGDTVYLSGQGGRDPETGTLPEGAGAQSEQTLRTIETILEAAGLAIENAVLVSSYVPPASEQVQVDAAIEALYTAGAAPSRATVCLSRLPGDIAVEITVIAADDGYITRLFAHDEPPVARSSPASLTDGVAYVSATSGVGETLREQFLDALGKQEDALGLAFMGRADVARLIAYLADIGDLDEVRRLVSEAFPAAEPAFVAIQARNPGGSAVALETIAIAAP